MPLLKADAVTAVLQDLHVVNRVGTVDTKDSTVVGLRFDNAVALLTARYGVTISPTDIAPALFGPLVAWLVEDCRALFYQEPDRAVQAAQENALLATARSLASTQSTVDGRLATAVLRALGVLGTAENPTPKDLALVSDRLIEVLDDLERRDVIVIAAPASIPSAAFDALRAFAVEVLAPELGGRAADPALKTLAEEQLRRVARAGYTVDDTAETRIAVRVLRMLGTIQPTENPSAAELAAIVALIEPHLRDLEAQRIVSLSDVEMVEEVGAYPAFVDYLVASLGPLQPRQKDMAMRSAASRLQQLAAGEPTYLPLVASYF